MKITDIISPNLTENAITDFLKGVFKGGSKDAAREAAKIYAAKKIGERMATFEITQGRKLTTAEAYQEAAQFIGPERLKDQKFMQEVFNEAEKISQQEIKKHLETLKSTQSGSSTSQAGAVSAEQAASKSNLKNIILTTGLFSIGAKMSYDEYSKENDKLQRMLQAGQLTPQQYAQEDQRNKKNLIYNLAADFYIPKAVGPFIAWFPGLVGKIPLLGRPFKSLSNKIKDAKIFTFAVGVLIMHYPGKYPGPGEMPFRNGSEFITWLLFLAQDKAGWGMGGESIQEIDQWLVDQANKALVWTNNNLGINLEQFGTNLSRAAELINNFKPAVPGKPSQMDATDSDAESKAPAKNNAAGTNWDWNSMKK